MRTKSLIITIASLIFLASCGCDGSSNDKLYEEEKEEKITVKGADGTEYESYQECCSMNDYDAAHRYLAKMENAGKSIHEASDYVFQQEALYLMSIGDEASKKRILYLLKEEGENNDSRVAMLIDLAIDDDDEAFVKKLGRQYTRNADNESLKKLSEYLISKSKSENKEYLKTIFKGLDKTELLLDFAITNNDNDFIDEYLLDNDISLNNNNLLYYLAKTNEKKYTDMIIGVLTQEEKIIGPKPQIKVYKVRRKDGSKGSSTAVDNAYDYMRSVKDFNEMCKNLLGIAIKGKNQFMAQRLVSKVKPGILIEDEEKETTDEGRWYYYADFYTLTANNDDINTAKATYQEAIKSGAFR